MIEVLTYDEILKTMKDKFKEESGCDVDDASDIGIRLRVLAGQLHSHNLQMKYVCNQLFIKSAKGDYLDEHAKMRGLKRRKSTKAHGTVRFSCEELAQSNIVIPKKTRCAILGDSTAVYETVEEVVLQQGQQSVEAKVIATQGGTKGNAAKGVVTTLVNPPQQITSVTNITELTGGSEEESDNSLRQRLFDSFSSISNGANPQFYVELAMQNPKVISANIINCARGAGTVDVVFETCEKEQSKIDEIQTQLNNLLKSKREIGTDAKAFNCLNQPIDITVYLKVSKGQDANAVISSCKDQISDYVSKLKVGENLRVSEVSNILYTTKGIENYKLHTPIEDTSISGRSKLNINNLNITNSI